MCVFLVQHHLDVLASHPKHDARSSLLLQFLRLHLLGAARWLVGEGDDVSYSNAMLGYLRLGTLCYDGRIQSEFDNGLGAHARPDGGDVEVENGEATAGEGSGRV